MFRALYRVLLLSVFCFLVLGIATALAHNSKEVGGKYLVSVGFTKEPPYTEERNGLDLVVRTAAGREPVENLEKTLFAEIIAPDGTTKRALPLRAQYGKPGYYTSDIMLTQPGIYKIRIYGMIHDVEFDQVFETHEVKPLSDLRFPG